MVRFWAKEDNRPGSEVGKAGGGPSQTLGSVGKEAQLQLVGGWEQRESAVIGDVHVVLGAFSFGLKGYEVLPRSKGLVCQKSHTGKQKHFQDSTAEGRAAR